LQKLTGSLVEDITPLLPDFIRQIRELYGLRQVGKVQPRING